MKILNKVVFMSALVLAVPTLVSAQEDALRNIPNRYRSLHFQQRTTTSTRVVTPVRRSEAPAEVTTESEAAQKVIVKMPKPTSQSYIEWPSWIGVASWFKN